MSKHPNKNILILICYYTLILITITASIFVIIDGGRVVLADSSSWSGEVEAAVAGSGSNDLRGSIGEIDSSKATQTLHTKLDVDAQQKQHQFRWAGSSAHNPVLFIPGDGGSQLEAKLNKTDRPHYLCDYKSDWYDIWLNLHLLIPPWFDCTIDNLKLTYNSTTRTTHNTVGVEIRPTNFGSLDSVDYLDTARVPLTEYFSTIIKTLEKRNNLVRNVDMIGAAYDFRLAPNELEGFFANLTELIETLYIMSNYKPVTLICHSMGCTNSFYLLNKQSQGWKDVYVRRLITLGAPWDGSFEAINAMLFGDNLGIPVLSKVKLQQLQSTFPSLMYLFPKGPAFEEDRVLVETPTANYTLKNLDSMFEEAKLFDQRDMWHDTRVIAANLKPPNVELWCLYGSGIPTPSKIVFQEPIDLSKPNYIEIQGDGDGTVNLESLRACEHFAKHQTKPVYTRQFDKTNHIDILRANQAAEFISTHILENDLLTNT